MRRLGEPPYICLITKGEATPSNFETEKNRILDTIREAVADGVNLIQIREKSLPARMLFELARSAVEILEHTSTLVLVNDRPDVAIAAGADGVHLPENSFPPGVVRQEFASEVVIGVSTHSIEQATAATKGGADFVFFGPVFETPGKGSPAGVETLQTVCRKLVPFPVIALGGIDQHNFELVFEAGAAGIAAIRALNETESRRQICAGLSTL